MLRAREALLAVASAIAVLAAPARADADDCSPITRVNVARCAVHASPAVKVERENVAAASGRRVATEPWFPSSPILSLSGARREGPGGGQSATNYYATLAQEIEIAGQRSARRRAAEADVAARKEDALAVARNAAAAAYVAYFDALAARDALAVAKGLEATAQMIAQVARERAGEGVGSPLDAELAEAASLRIVQNRIAAERTVRTAAVRLAVVVGRDPIASAPAVDGALEPLKGAEGLTGQSGARLLLDRPELRSLAQTRRQYEARADSFRRARVPNLTLQIFAQNDGFNERVLGAGLSLPLPLPQPIARRYTGEIAEAEALARRTGREADVTARALSGRLAAAVADYRSRRSEAELFTEERVDRATKLLAEIGKEIGAGRLPVRDALVAQQQLIDVVRGYVDARHALCVSSVELALASGVPLEAGGL